MTECCDTDGNPPPMPPDYAVVAQGVLDELKRKQALLTTGGFASQIVSPPGSSG
jgi:hypothetical protein